VCDGHQLQLAHAPEIVDQKGERGAAVERRVGGALVAEHARQEPRYELLQGRGLRLVIAGLAVNAQPELDGLRARVRNAQGRNGLRGAPRGVRNLRGVMRAGEVVAGIRFPCGHAVRMHVQTRSLHSPSLLRNALFQACDVL
jgi:hypothetical protein